MTCELCDRDAGERDMRKPCCAAREIERATRDDAARLLHQIAHKFGHDPADLRRRIADIRRAARKPSGEPAR